MSLDELKEVFASIGIYGVPGILVGIFIGILIVINWPSVKLFFVDIFWKGPHTLFKGGRKFNVKCEIEASIGLFVNNFNAEMTNKLLPACQIQWLNKDNQDGAIQEGRAIVVVSYSKDNHDLNFYNAAY